MKRRTLLASLGASVATPAIGQSASVLKFVPQADLATLDPVQSTAIVTFQHALMVFDTLYGVDAAGHAQPQMVDGHSVEDNGLTWRLTLREGLQFHDNEPVLARDAVASIRRWAARDGFGSALMAATDSVIAESDRVLTFRLVRPFPLLPDALAKASATIAIVMPERLAQTPPTAQVVEMVGSGPFRFLASERVSGALAAYARFDRYVPRTHGIPSFLAGPKVARFDRVEWNTIPDAATAAAALQAGEVDWLETVPPDLIPSLARHRGIQVRSQTLPGYAASLRPNHLHPPFDNPAVRRALMGAISQADCMTAAAGDDRSLWREDVGFFHPQSPMASDVGMAAISGSRNLGVVRREIEAAGYKGEPAVLLVATDRPALNAMSEVVADVMRRAGLTVDYRALDWGSVLQRTNSREPVAKGGWSAYVTGYVGPAIFNPASHGWLRGNGAAAPSGWPSSASIERLRDAWFLAPTLEAQQTICRELQAAAFHDVPYYPLGLANDVTAFRRSLSGVLGGPILFHNVRRS